VFTKLTEKPWDGELFLPLAVASQRAQGRSIHGALSKAIIPSFAEPEISQWLAIQAELVEGEAVPYSS
jgi:hypothetical protein